MCERDFSSIFMLFSLKNLYQKDLGGHFYEKKRQTFLSASSNFFRRIVLFLGGI